MQRRWFLIVLVLGLFLTACGDDGGGDDAAGDTSTTTSAPVVSTPTTGGSEPATGVGAAVYFARDGQVATAGRSVEPPAVARGAVDALLAGPDELEAGLGMTSAIPAGTVLRDVTIEDGLATVDLSGEFLTEPSGDTALRVAEVVFTLTQFPTVDRVTLLIEEVSGPTVGPEAVPVVEVDRSDFEDQTPFVLVESPTPGAAVASPVQVTGTSNTFEATVLYEVLDADGTVLDDGFTTATSGTGTWGTFDFTTGAVPSGEATLRVFQESGEDGSPIDVYEVPITVG